MLGNELLQFQFPGLLQVNCVFTTRKGGVSQGPYAWNNLSYSVADLEQNVFQNRCSLQNKLGVKALQGLNQIHSSKMIWIKGQNNHTGSIQQADAVATEQRHLALMIQTADCQPLLLAHASGRYIAALHVGWRANRAWAPSIWVEQFCKGFGLSPQDVLAVRGPSLSPRNSEFVNFEAEWGPEFLSYFQPETRTMDLWSLSRDQLCQAGVPRENIFGFDLCTFEMQEEFFSFRRQGVCGRQAGLIWLS
ncbi:MAG: polyphenol oxidase family protein [Desulfohalobiaceae bacterium]